MQQGNAFSFYVWDEAFTQSQKLFTIYAFTGEDRQELAARDNRFALLENETTVYAAYLEVAAASYGISQDTLIQSFRLIHQDWKTGET